MQHGHVRDTGLAQPAERAGQLGHLHQRMNALLHAGAARGGHDDERQTRRQRVLDDARELLAHGRAHAAAEEMEVEDGDRDRHRRRRAPSR